MFKFSEQPLSIGEVYGQSFSFYKNTFTKVWFLVFINMLLIGVVQFIASQYVKFDANMTLANLPKPQGLIFMAANFIAFIVEVYFISLVIHRMNVLAGGIADTNSFRAVGGKWFTLTMTKLIVVLIVLLGSLAFIVPAVFFVVFFVFCIPIVLFENKGPGGAIKRSFQLVWGNWWRTFVVLIPAGIILFIGSLLEHVLYDYIKNSFVLYGITTLFFTIFLILIYAFVLVQYNDLKLRKPLKTA